MIQEDSFWSSINLKSSSTLFTKSRSAISLNSLFPLEIPIVNLKKLTKKNILSENRFSPTEMSSTYFGPEKNILKKVYQRGELETISSSINFNLKNIQKNNKIDELMTNGKKYAFPSNNDTQNSNFSNYESNKNVFNLVNSHEQLNDFSSHHPRGRTRDAQNPRNTCTRRSVSLINYLKENVKKDSITPQNLNNNSEFTVPNQRQFNSSIYGTNLEKNIILSQNPLAYRENGMIRVNDVTGTWLNRDENLNWKGVLPLDQYPLNNDPNPIVVKKKPLDKIKYTQEINVKYLKPPKIPNAGDLIIQHDAPRQIPPAPSLIIRQYRPRPPTPPPLVIREEPPKTPETIPTKVVTIPGRLLPPPPRKLIIEKMPQDPQKPQSILIERWLPYNDIRRRVIYQKPSIPKHFTQKTKNVIIDWQKPDVQITQELKYLGIEETNPSEYRQKYSKQLNASDKLPEFVHRLEHPHGIVFASQKPKPNIHLEGDIDALELIDLDQAGLTELKESTNNPISNFNVLNSFRKLLKEIFDSFDTDNDEFISKLDARDALFHLIDRFETSVDIFDDFFNFFQNVPSFLNFSDFLEIANKVFRIPN